MSRPFAGARLRRLREERGLTQAALARVLDLSTSYVNQLENDARPVTVAVLLRLTERFDLSPHYFSPDSDARLVADLGEIFTEAAVGEISDLQLEELVARMPSVGQTLVGMHRRLRDVTAELESYRATENAATIGDSIREPMRPMPFEEVRDLFYDHKNHLGELDTAAEELFEHYGLHIGGLDVQLAAVLKQDHGINVTVDKAGALSDSAKRRFDQETGVLRIAHWLTPGQRAFQMATQLALLTQTEAMAAILSSAEQLSPEAVGVARIGLANYFAGAFLLPYKQFHHEAEAVRYDIDLLARRYEVGFETVCHRLSTLQRPASRGVPFILVRTDQAGNISKRQSATAFHFSRVGGNCPLWVIHNAFSQPGQFVTQVAEMPDGRLYFWIARTTSTATGGFLSTPKSFAIGLGCDIAHAHRLVYSTGIAIDDPSTAVPIGPGCKVCVRESCSQRAFPYIGRSVHVDEDASSRLPYT